jgi:hypothetical protein
MGPALKQLVINEVAEERTVTATGLAHGTSSGNIISLILKHVKLFYHEKLIGF